jgi:hypothetical protein
MPVYTFENINTGDEIVVEMKISELDDFKASNPDLRQLIVSATPSVDPILLGVTKPPSDFQKHVLGRIKKGAGKDNYIGKGRWDV